MKSPTDTIAPTQRRRPVRRRKSRIQLVVIAAVAALSLLLAACGGSDSGETSADGMWVEYAEPGLAQEAFDVAESPAAAEERGMPTEPGPPISGAPTGRSVIRSGEIWLETRDTAAALDDVLAVARQAGGYAATTDLRRSEDGAVTGTVTLRVPSERLDEVMAELEAIGTSVPLSRIDEYDVTTEVTDVEARLMNLRAFEAELLDLLAEVRRGGGGAEELVVVFERIREVRWEIEHLEARERSLDDQISMATIHVRIQQPAGPPSAGDVTWRPSDTLVSAWAATVRTLAFLADAVIWFALTIVPIALILLALPGAAVWWWYRRRVRSTTPAAVPDTATGAAPPPAPHTKSGLTTPPPSDEDASDGSADRPDKPQ
ncbi:MAG: DUF4349 domain-containing protein [Nitriliruptoraceae bacterium]